MTHYQNQLRITGFHTNNLRFILFFTICMLLPNLNQAETILKFNSSTRQVNFLELYTSQGCSSCPAADAWLSEFKHSPLLWKQIVPVAFHVDYWDWIGWKDLYASKAYSARQRAYHKKKHIQSVYTPGFIYNGNEWRGWFTQKTLPTTSSHNASSTNPATTGILKANVNQKNQLTLYWQAANTKQSTTSPLIAHVALLGFDLNTPVLKGENSRRQLKEDFVVLWYQQHRSKTERWQITLADRKQFDAPRFGIAVWLTEVDSMQPIQATGSWF